MNKSQIITALLLGYSFTATQAMGLSVQVHFGVTENSHQTEADILNRFDEFRAFELVEDYRKKSPYEDTVEGTFDAYDNGGTEKFGFELFVEGDKTGQPWANSTSNVHLLNYELDTVNDTITIQDEILTGTDATINEPPISTDYTDNFVQEREYPVGAPPNPNPSLDPYAIYSFAGKSLTITAIDGLDFQVPTVNEEPLPVYTTESIYRDVLSENLYLPNTYIIMSTDNFDKMMQLHTDLTQTIDSRSGSSLYGQEKFMTLDAGLNLSYDVGNMVLQVSAGAHYPLPTADRRSIDIIAYNPTSYLDASFGVLLKYGAGKIGGSIGMSQVRGDYLLRPIKYVDSSGNPQNVDYIDYRSSYTLQPLESALAGEDGTRSISSINEAIYFAEIRAEGSPITENGLSIFGKYRLGLTSDDSATLQKLKVSRNSISIGATLTFYNIS